MMFRTLAIGLLAPAILVAAPRLDHRPVVPDGGRSRANSLTRMAVPQPNADTPVIVDILDSSGHIIWTGATREANFECFTRDWADGVYTVRCTPGGEQSLNIDSEYFGRVIARCGLLLRDLEARRDADGLPPKELLGVSNLLQRIMTEWVWSMPKKDLDDQLYHCEYHLGFRTAGATVRILGSGASEYMGYDGPPRRFQRERTMMFMPPNAVVDFSQYAERKLARWGYRIEDVDHVLISHDHADHFNAKAVADFAVKRRQAKLPTLQVYSGPTTCRLLREHLAERKLTGVARIHEMLPGQEYEAGEITVKPVRATHKAAPVPLCLIMRWRGTTVYYGTDSGYPSAETMAELMKERFDVFAHDTTVASADDGVTHQDLGDLLLLVGKLRRAGAIDTWTHVATLHQSPQGPQVLPNVNQWQRRVGFECSYDGMPLPIAFHVPLEK